MLAFFFYLINFIASLVHDSRVFFLFSAHLPVEPLVPVPVPPVGLQLVRDPNTGHFLLIPTTGIGKLSHLLLNRGGLFET